MDEKQHDRTTHYVSACLHMRHQPQWIIRQEVDGAGCHAICRPRLPDLNWI